MPTYIEVISLKMFIIPNMNIYTHFLAYNSDWEEYQSI